MVGSKESVLENLTGLSIWQPKTPTLPQQSTTYHLIYAR